MSKSDMRSERLRQLKRLLDEYYRDLINRDEPAAAADVSKVRAYVEEDL